MRALGLDVGGTNVKAAVLEDGEILETRQVLSQGATAGALGVIRAEAGAVDVLGVGLAGLVRWPEGRLVWGPHLSGADMPRAADLSAELGLPVVVDNDANMAALAELRAGAAQDVDSALVLTLGTGIGAAIVVDGEVYRGRSFAGEVGHVKARGGHLPCACGRSGCWETLVAGPVLDGAAERLAAHDPRGLVYEEAGGAAATAVHLVAAAERGDEPAQTELSAFGERLGRLIADQVAVLDPEVVVVAGAVSAAGDWFLSSARTSLSTYLHGAAYRDPVDIRLSPFGAYAGAIGAALAAMEIEHD